MKTVYSIILLLFISLQSESQNYNWAKQAGGNDADEAYCVAYDNAGNSYITGTFSGTATFQTTVLTSAGGTDMFLAKYDASGNLVWVQQAGSTGNQGGHMVATDPAGDVYVTGEFENTITFGASLLTSSGMADIFLVKYNSAGSVQWTFQGGSTGTEEANGLKTDPTGNIYMTGNFESVLYFGANNIISIGSTDVFVAKFSTFGGLLWLVRAGSVLQDDSRGIAVDNNGNVCIAGWFQQVASFGTYTLNAIGSMKEIFIAGLNTSGTFAWAAKAGGTDDDGAYEADADAAGNFYVAGNFKGIVTFGSIIMSSNNSSDDVFVAMVSPAGVFNWVAAAGGAGSDKAYSLSYSSTGKIFCTGSYEGSATFGTFTLNSNGDKDIFITSINTGGGFLWAWSAGGAGYDRGYSIKSNAAGSVWVTGRFEQNVSFGSTLLTAAGMNDIFLTRIETVVSVPEYENDNTINVFPNPVQEYCELRIDNLELNEKLDITFTDSKGSVVLHDQSIINNQQPIIKIEVSSFSTGIYFLKVTGSNGTSFFKIIKE